MKERYIAPQSEYTSLYEESALLGLSDGNPIVTPSDTGILPEPVLPSVGL